MKIKTKWKLEIAIGVLLYVCILAISFMQGYWTRFEFYYVAYPIPWAIFCLFRERKIFPNHWKRNSLIRISVVILFLAVSINYSVNDLWAVHVKLGLIDENGQNQQVDPIVTTPVDKVEAQSTQGHP